MDVTPQELRGSEIKEAWRGYHRDEVDELLERAAVTIEGLSQQLATASTRPAPEPAAAARTAAVPVNRDDAEMLQRTLLLAQRAADDAVNEAQAQARKLIEESEARAQTLVGEAEATARRIAESERRRLEAEIHDLVARRDTLAKDADALEEYASAYRDRVRAAIEADLERLTTGTIEAPGPRPDVEEVEIPEAVAAPSATPELQSVPDVEPERGGPSAGLDDPFGSDTRVITIDSSASASGFGAAPSSVAAPPRPSEPEWPPPAPEASRSPGPIATASPTPAATGVTTANGGWLTGEDELAAEAPFDDALPWEQPTAVHEVFSSDVPMEAHAIEGDALDDDAFFASLRDAVREEQPLGPNDDEPNAFFDDGDATDDRRRFRRRR
jgi:DivIVA domain-containing protein